MTKTEKFSFSHEVAVIANNNQEVLIGMDVTHFNELWRVACQAQQVCVNVNTRSQTEKLANEELKEKLLCEQGAASPDSVDIKQTEEEEKQCYSDDTEVVKDTSSDDLQEELIENESPDTKALTKNISEQGDTDEWPLPNLSDKGDKQKLVAQQQQDPSLHKIRKWAELGENQYNYNEGVLVHFQEEKWVMTLCK